MIEENNSNVIVMLCNEKEDGKEKCSNYWSGKTTIKKYKIKEEKVIKPNNYFIIRDIKFINKFTGKEKTVKHINFIAWRDHDVPLDEDGKVFGIFNIIINKIEEYKKTNPIVVHCSAGVVRTGTFISMYSLYKEIKKQIVDNVK